MVVFDRLSLSCAEQMTALLSDMLVRAIMPTLGSALGYADPAIPAAWADHIIVCSWVGSPAVAAATAVQLCRTLKINVFSTDAFTVLASKCLEKVSSYHRTLNCYLLSRCSSKELGFGV